MFAVEAPANSAKWFLENCLQNWLSLGKICSYGKRRYWENLKERESKREGRGNRLKANFKQVALVFLCPNCSIIFYPNTFWLTIENFILARVTLIHLCSYLSSGWVFCSLGFPALRTKFKFGSLVIPIQLTYVGVQNHLGSHGFASSQLRKGKMGTSFSKQLVLVGLNRDAGLDSHWSPYFPPPSEYVWNGCPFLQLS